NFQIIPVLRLADAADRRKVPLHLARQGGLGDQLLTAEQAFGVVPLAAGVDIFAAGEELPGPDDACGVLHPGGGARVDRYRLMIGGVGLAAALGRQEAIEVPLSRQLGILRKQVAGSRVGELTAAQLPVAPAALLLQVVGHVLDQLLYGVPTATAQRQAAAPFGNGVV